MFDFDTQQLPGGIAVVNVQGSLDDSNRAYFFNCVADLVEEGFVQIIVDCSGLGFVSSAGLAGLIHARSKATTNGGKVYLTHVEAKIAEVLTLTRLNKLLAIYPTTSELVELLTSNSQDPIALEPEA